MFETIHAKPFLVAMLAGAAAQLIKVISFLIVEKKVDYKRFVETGGSPNMHSAATVALSMYIGFVDGFASIVFALSMSMTIMVSIDTWNVRGAHLRHQEFIVLILDRLSDRRGGLERSRKALSYTPVDVFTGAALGVVISLLVV
jgi:acid phosphatase family membrane protein YuiD